MSAHQPRRERSPNYPAIGFRSAVQFASRIYERERRNPTPRAQAMQLMGYRAVTGAAQANLSALKKYGLLVDHGSSVRISDEAHRLLAYPEGSAERARIEHELATRPPLFREILREYPNGLPADDSLRGFLIAEHGFTELAAGILVKVLNETFRDSGEMVRGMPRETVTATQGEPGSNSKRRVRPEASVRSGADAPSDPDGSQVPLPLVWSVGNGITVEVRSNLPLKAKNFRLLAKYVSLAAEAAELEESNANE